ncbi:MAG: alpha/beta hydrolase-fold protein, partial [Alcanivorax sediminis]|uniref:alpha/beta hydrolase-fold protein n=1 Tax=Alcanivorax sediminis TaxID=2663008 RepID=UPI003C4C96CE
CELIRQHGSELPLLVDQGEADNFYTDGQLLPEDLQVACQEAGVKLELRMQPGYDHSYFFIASFIDDHLKYHAEKLK